MERVLSREAIRELDRAAIEDYGIPSIVLMENAGRACAQEARALLSSPKGGRVVVLCGPGNNGGDGFVIARTLWNGGIESELVFVGPRAKLVDAPADVKVNARLWRGLGRETVFVETVEESARLRPVFDGADVVVDALFGTGLTRTLRDPWADVVRTLNLADRPVLAVDLPSGLDANSGAVLGAAVRATTTVSFIARKPGFTQGAGPEHCGRVIVAEIGIPRHLIEAAEGESKQGPRSGPSRR